MWRWGKRRDTAPSSYESRFLLELASIDLGDWQVRHKNPHNADTSLADPPSYYMLVFERDGCHVRFYHNDESQECRIVVNDEEVYAGLDDRLTDLWDRIFDFAKLSELEKKYARAAHMIRLARQAPDSPPAGR